MAEAGIRARLVAALERHAALAVAVSGGVDSMTLASFAHRFTGTAVTVIHAASPAVPADATARVRQQAEAEGWALTVTDAGEFADPRYRANPHDRCYFCKSNLYGRIRALTSGPVASGANTDDLGDYRPGLLAASEGGVVHPMIEAAMGKADVRALARHIGLPGIAELPAQPCLASRVETGIAIDADDLRFVERVERHLARIAGSRAVLRCRITAGGVVVEIGPECEPLAAALSDGARALAAADGRSFAGLRSYRRGSMFVRA